MILKDSIDASLKTDSLILKQVFFIQAVYFLKQLHSNIC